MLLGGAMIARTLSSPNMLFYFAAAAAIAMLPRCIVDNDNVCDENQVEQPTQGLAVASCVCAPNSVPHPRGYGCVKCGEHEVAQNNACVCDVGYAKAGEDGVCVQAAIGAPCDDDNACQEPFPFCVDDAEARYCSSENCSASSCPSGYACEQTSASSYCKKLPKGLGASCASDTDCASGEAKSCDTFQTHTCILTGCAGGQVKCPGFYGCCDVSDLVPGFSVCSPPASLTSDGQCAFGKLVKP